MNIVFVTVGTSAVKNEKLWERGELKKFMPGSKHVERFVEGLEEGDAPPEGFEALLAKAHSAFWDRNDNERGQIENRRLTSAEAISTWSAMKSGLFALRGGVDRVVLIESNTSLGKLCGSVNQRIGVNPKSETGS